ILCYQLKEQRRRRRRRREGLRCPAFVQLTT
ncbi:unnamed protein product, partial [Rotaria sp. Silwood2]